MNVVFDTIGQLLCGVLLADVLSGLFHWWQDVYGDVRTPIVGPMIVLGARQHHEDANDFLTAGLIKRNRGVWVATAALSLPWLLLGGLSPFWLAATVAAAMSGEIHVLTHRPDRQTPPLRALRATGLVQSCAQHMRHHRTPTTSYCVVTNWLNPILDGLGFWSGLERGFAVVGIRPSSCIRT
jgi:hypothetical protein